MGNVQSVSHDSNSDVLARAGEAEEAPHLPGTQQGTRGDQRGQDTPKGFARRWERRGERGGTSAAWAAPRTRGQLGPEPPEGTPARW